VVFLIGQLPKNAAAPPSLGVFALRTSKILGWWWLARPNAFFDGRTNAPSSAPRVFTPSERAVLDWRIAWCTQAD